MKLDEQTLLEFRIELEELVTEREAMIALNMTRESGGNVPGYDDGAFFDLLNQMKALRKNLISLGER